MDINVNIAIAFVTGAVIPIIIALLGKESIGKLLYARQARETTALEAIIQLAQESVAGWRESNASILMMSTSLEGHKAEVSTVRERIFAGLVSQDEKLESMQGQVSSLIRLLADSAMGK